MDTLKAFGYLKFSRYAQHHENPKSKGKQTCSFTWEIYQKPFGLNNRTRTENKIENLLLAAHLI